METIWILLGILSLIYYICICLVMKKWNSSFSRFWILAGIMFIACGLLNHIAIDMILAIGIGLFLGMELQIFKAMSHDSVPSLPYIIVLGAKVNGTVVSESLRRRLEKAYTYLKENPDTRVIVSGSMLGGEEITEAEAMKRYLMDKGIDAERIIKEENSYTTKQNLKFSREFIEDKEAAVGIVTNNYHIYRSLVFAKRLGYNEVYGIVADCHPVLIINYMTREFFALMKIWLTKDFTML